MILLCLASDDYLAKYKFCIESQKKYCLKYNYTYKLITGKQEARNWKRSKIDELEALLKSSDVCLIDADCFIKSNSPAFETFLTEKSIYYVNGKSGRLNSGFLYFKNDDLSKKFIKELKEKLNLSVPKGKGYFVTESGENGHIIWLKAEYEERNELIFQEIPNLWNCTSPNLQDQAYVLHFTNYLKNYLYLAENLIDK